MQGQIANFKKLFNYSSMHKMKNRLLLSLTTLFLALPVLAATLPEGVNYAINSDGKTLTITKSTFSGDLVIPETVDIDGKEYKVTIIGATAFQNCPGLTSIQLPPSVTMIGRYAFNKCSDLTSVVIPPSVVHIEERAFGYCTALSSIEIPSSVLTIGVTAFEGCSSMVSINVTDNFNFESVDGILFNKAKTVLLCYPAGKAGTDGKYTIPEYVKELGDYSFSGCKKLHAVEIPATVKSAGIYVFKDCTYLTSVSIPESFSSISKGLF